MPDNFLPIDCKLRAEIADSINGTSIKTIYDPEKKPGDPSFIHASDPPATSEAEARDDHLMHKTTHATAKPVNISNEGAAVHPSQVPGESGETEYEVDNENWTMNIRYTGGPSLPDDFLDAAASSDVNKGLVDLSISDVKAIFNADNECSRFFEQAVRTMSIYSTEGGITTEAHFYVPKYDASVVADTLGKQLRENIRYLSADKAKNTTIGIEMKSPNNSGTIHQYGDSTLRYEEFGSARVNINGPFIKTGTFGNYTGSEPYPILGHR